jgi:hypothetical protein
VQPRLRQGFPEDPAKVEQFATGCRVPKHLEGTGGALDIAH